MLSTLDKVLIRGVKRLPRELRLAGERRLSDREREAEYEASVKAKRKSAASGTNKVSGRK